MLAKLIDDPFVLVSTFRFISAILGWLSGSALSGPLQQARALEWNLYRCPATEED
ncbi:MAG: hypothetical protein JJE01_08440 [Gemmatimonadetes bacterium]|nr:hypothetical protein [Gemmatimonadota bacterium]